MDKALEEVKKLTEINLIRDIQIRLLAAKIEGLIINDTIINEILRDLEGR